MLKFFSNKILNGQSRTIASAALILALTSLASRFLGLIRDRLLAGHFGAGDTLDVYYAAFRIPDTIYNLLVLGALSAGFIPVFVGLWNKNKESQDGVVADRKVWDFVNNVLNILGAGLIIAAAVFFIFTPFLMKIITPGFGGQKMELTISLTRIMFLSPILLGISSIWGGILQSVKRFLIFSLTPIFYNLGIIFGILFLVPRFGIYGLAYGVVIGAVLHFLIQLPSVFALGYRYRLVFNWADGAVRRMAKLTLPRILTLAVAQLNSLAITILASNLASGSLAIFDLSYNIWSFPLGIFAGSLAMAAFPALSLEVKTADCAAFAKTFSNTFRQILFLIIPTSIFFIVLREQIIKVILGTGKFNLQNIALTADTFKFLTLALFADGLILLLVRGFFAWEDTKTPFWIGLTSSLFRIFGAWIFSFHLGVAGLALGYAIGSVVNLVLLWFFLARKTGDLNSKEIFVSGFKIIIASAAAGGAVYAGLGFLAGFINTSKFLGVFAQGFIAGLVGILVFFLAAWLLKSQEMFSFFDFLKNRLPFKAVVPKKEMIQR